MSYSIDELIKNKFFIVALIIYIIYVVILFVIAIPYIPEMLNPDSDSSGGGMYINPILIFGGAAAAPVILAVIILEFNQVATPFLALDRRILVYTTFFLWLQIGLNILLAFCLVLVKPDLLNLSTFGTGDALLIWLIGCGFSLITVAVNIFVGWKWVKIGLERPNGLHWFVGYIIYYLTVTFGIFFTWILNPSVQNIILWPFAGIGILGALNFFLVAFGLFIAGLAGLGSSMSSGEGDAFIGFVFMMGMVFMVAVIFLPFFYMLTFYVGVQFAKRSVKSDF